MATGEDIHAEFERNQNAAAEAEAKKAFEDGGADKLTAYAKKKLDEWKTTPVQIAVVGQSGSGKSSFINTIRDMEDDEDPLFAEVDEEECTRDPKSYALPDNDLIKLWDLPGAGTSNVKAAEYAEQMEFSKYDAFVLLSCDRFTEIDKMIAEEIKQIKKPFFFARTKMDNVMRDRKRRLKLKFDHSTASQQIKGKCLEHLGKDSQDKIFLIANLPQPNLKKEFPDIHFGNEDLTAKITQSLPEIQKTALGKKIMAAYSTFPYS